MRNTLFIILALLLTCCSEVINLDTDEQGGELVIFGRISNSNIGNYVEVTRTNSSGQAPVPFECVSCLVQERILPLECIFCYLAPGFKSRRPSYF